MKSHEVAVFFVIFFTVYGLLNWYLFTHGWRALPPGSSWRTPYLVLFLVLSLSFFAGRFLERMWISPLSDGLVWIGSFWMGALLYLLMAALLVDFVRVVNAVTPFLPADLSPETPVKILGAVVLLVTLLMTAGWINAMSPVTRQIDLRIAKRANADRTYRIVAASDIHLGTIIGRRRLRHLVERINGLSPDLVLFPGDIVDEDLGPVVKENLGEVLRDISARDGVYGVTGNHEYIGGVEAACRYLTEHGIVMLRDSVVRLQNGIVLLGREDRSSRSRKSLETMLAGTDGKAPLIVMDHQPFRLSESQAVGADLQLSGHTHDGQLWPLNYITAAVYEVSWGLVNKGGTAVYVSCGFGTWGPPVRIGNRPEILDITLHFEGGGSRL
jgi:predicted MPP superfamily phosphohydrolase